MDKWTLNAPIGAVFLMIAACSSVPQKDNPDAVKSDELVTLDFVNVIYQVSDLNPASTTLLIPKEVIQNDDFAQTLLLTLQQAGYAIRTQIGASQSKAVSYSVTRQSDTNEQPVVTYTIQVGDVSVRRSYQQQADGWIRPVAAMQIKGADASLLSINDDIFNRTLDAQPKSIDASDLPESTPSGTDSPAEQPSISPEIEPSGSEIIASLPIDKDPVSVASAEFQSQDTLPAQSRPRVGEDEVPLLRDNLTPLAMRTPLRKRRPLLDIVAPGLNVTDTEQPLTNFSDLRAERIANFRDLGQSNFTNILDQLGTVKETVLTFDNDSTRLGSTNKERVKQFVAQFDPIKDVFSVIGCSQGGTSYQGGQQALALGRASRVREELRFAGIPNDKILEEGCWAYEQFDDRMPRRGVVLSLKRRS